MTGGVFLAVEGPNGVGKTACAGLLAARLTELGHEVVTTTEPTRTPLGELVRSGEANLTGQALALAVAADRADHIQREINPALAAGHTVVTDRYVPSSLVLQRIDGMEPAEIWRYNAFAPAPDLTFYLHVAPGILTERLNERAHLSRLERTGGPARELELYDDAFRFLGRRRWRQARIDCQNLDPNAVVQQMLARIELLNPER